MGSNNKLESTENNMWMSNLPMNNLPFINIKKIKQK